jgi:hypothetical protein
LGLDNFRKANLKFVNCLNLDKEKDKLISKFKRHMGWLFDANSEDTNKSVIGNSTFHMMCVYTQDLTLQSRSTSAIISSSHTHMVLLDILPPIIYKPWVSSHALKTQPADQT